MASARTIIISSSRAQDLDLGQIQTPILVGQSLFNLEHYLPRHSSRTGEIWESHESITYSNLLLSAQASVLPPTPASEARIIIQPAVDCSVVVLLASAATILEVRRSDFIDLDTSLGFRNTRLQMMHTTSLLELPTSRQSCVLPAISF